MKHFKPPRCKTCRKIRRGVEYAVRTLTDTDYRARRRYEAAQRACQMRLKAVREK